ncbi:MAG: hypothetical protein ACP5D7_16300 [Limnospira sp.]
MGKKRSRHKKKGRRIDNFYASFDIDDLVKTSRKLVANSDGKIVTDAGWERLTFAEACQYFPAEEIREWYQQNWQDADLEYLIDDLEIDLDLEDDEAVERFLETYDWTPTTLEIIVAKAVYQDHAWARPLVMAWREWDSEIFESYESQALSLGIYMREQLNLDIPVINDCQKAVIWFSGYSFVGWQRRRFVKPAHALKISKATRVVTELEWEEWESKWCDNVECSIEDLYEELDSPYYSRHYGYWLDK